MYDAELSALLTNRARGESFVFTLKTSNDPSREMATRLPDDRLLNARLSGSATSNCASCGAGADGLRVPSQIAASTAAIAVAQAAVSRTLIRESFLALAVSE